MKRKQDIYNVFDTKTGKPNLLISPKCGVEQLKRDALEKQRKFATRFTEKEPDT